MALRNVILVGECAEEWDGDLAVAAYVLKTDGSLRRAPSRVWSLTSSPKLALGTCMRPERRRV